MPNLNLNTPVKYRPTYHKGDVNESARNRAASRTAPLTDQGRRNYDHIKWGSKSKPV